MKTYLIADSGSTKTSWAFIDNNGHRTDFETQGINPVRDRKEEIENTIKVLPIVKCQVSIVNFYGAGCIAPYVDTVIQVLRKYFPESDIHVESDLLGAAHALCGHQEGIACILGTGSNSCLYDGRQIIANVSPLGWILGDEGSGAVLGRRLVGDVLKAQLSPELCQAFAEETRLTRTDIINKVYRELLPNRFLASLTPFLYRHRRDKEIKYMLIDEFRRFLRRNVVQYHRPELPVSFVGGIAHSYSDELQAALLLEGLKMGKINQKPIDGIVDYLTKS